jgi:hypothetical protein
MTMSRGGIKRDRRARPDVSPHPGISDVAEGTLRGSPAQMLIHLSGEHFVLHGNSRKGARRASFSFGVAIQQIMPSVFQ